MTKRGRPAKPGGQGSQVRIAPDLASKARMIVGDRGIALVEYLDGILRSQITRDYAALIRKLDGSEIKGGR
jgi:hypothetical protein